MFFLLPVLAGVIATTTTITIATSTAAAVGLGVAAKKIADAVEEDNRKKVAMAYEEHRREIEDAQKNANRRKYQKQESTKNELADEIRNSNLSNREKEHLMDKLYGQNNLLTMIMGGSVCSDK